MVEQISGVNENAGLLYLTGTMDGPLESNLYCTKLFPDWNLTLQPPKRLTYGRGRHAGTFDHHMQTFVVVHDSLNSLPRVLLCSLHDESIITPLYEQPLTIPRFGKLPKENPDSYEYGSTTHHVHKIRGKLLLVHGMISENCALPAHKTCQLAHCSWQV
ncbi:unnamed protein product [Musa acuminata subsp. burmannicoides]